MCLISAQWVSLEKGDEYFVAYKLIILLCILFMFIEMKIYLSSFLCDVCNEVHKHMQ